MYSLHQLEKLTKEISDIANKRNYEFQLDDLRAGTELIHDRVVELITDHINEMIKIANRRTWWQKVWGYIKRGVK
jgi:hypothetical protein